MSARKSYNYYQTGTAARKLEYINDSKKRNTVNKKNKNVNMSNSKRKTSSVVIILVIFAMALVLVYRYNVINEKNLKSQSLANEVIKAESALVSSQIEVEQNTDLNQIEAYAKQKLGMQKPDKNQTIYVDTSKANNSVEIQSTSTFFENIGKTVSDFVGKIF